MKFSESNELCNIHGGKLIVPKSDQESEKILDIVSKNKKECTKNSNSREENVASRFNHERTLEEPNKCEGVHCLQASGGRKRGGVAPRPATPAADSQATTPRLGASVPTAGM